MKTVGRFTAQFPDDETATAYYVLERDGGYGVACSQGGPGGMKNRDLADVLRSHLQHISQYGAVLLDFRFDPNSSLASVVQELRNEGICIPTDC